MMFRFGVSFIFFATRSSSFQPLGYPCPSLFRRGKHQRPRLAQFSSTERAEVGMPPSWEDLSVDAGVTPVGAALNKEVDLRKNGKGSAHVQNKVGVHTGKSTVNLGEERLTDRLIRSQKTMLLIEEKEVPIKIELVPMRSYGDKPTEFMRKVPGGLLPAIEVQGQVITESQVIMELLDKWHSEDEGYKPMMPRKGDNLAEESYKKLAQLERELFSWWCTLVFRPESGLGGNPIKSLLVGNKSEMSGSMQGFMDCMTQVDRYLLSTKGPWFFDEHDHPTMIDFVYVSHVERMLASCAYWKGLNLRDPKWNLKGLNRWLEAFEQRECYLAFKSDYYTHVMDIPPQYGPGYTGGFRDDQESFSQSIAGRDGSWSLPLPHDDPLQPLYNGPPLPSCVLEASQLFANSDGSYEQCDELEMAKACRQMAAWKLAGNGEKVARFAARAGPRGSKNFRKTFGAELADPYADPDGEVQPLVSQALRVVCNALLLEDVVPGEDITTLLKTSVPKKHSKAVTACLIYLRNRVGVPRDLPLASARYLRAYLNWAIDTLSSSK